VATSTAKNPSPSGPTRCKAEAIQINCEAVAPVYDNNPPRAITDDSHWMDFTTAADKPYIDPR
ncbi:MAG: hypothetical protein QGH25_21510, partial [Candidatus Latescibacteria bacterium]|nr:hypothetical protein [Candidatus Latescibacterota bacterium]